MRNCWISLTIVVLALTVFSAGACADTKGAPLAKLKIGAILPLSGEAAGLGSAAKNAITLALEKIPPDLRARIEVIFEDDQLKPATSVSAFRKLTTVDNIDVLYNESSGTGKALAPLAESAGIPFVAIATDPEIAAGRKYVVLFWVTPETEVKVMLAEALRRGYKKVARISSQQQGMLAGRSAFDKLNAGKIAVVLDEEYPMDVKDFRTYITKLRNVKDLDAVFVNMMPGQCGLFARQLRQADVHLPLVGFETMEDSKEVEVSQGALLGAWYVNASDGNGNFMAEFRRRFPDSSMYGASNAFDATIMIAAAFQSAPSREGINSYLHNVKNFKGVLGTYSATGDNRFDLPAAIKEITKDGFQTVSMK